MFFSVVMQFVYSLEKETTKNSIFRDGGGRLRGTRAEGQEGKMLVADNRELQ